MLLVQSGSRTRSILHVGTFLFSLACIRTHLHTCLAYSYTLLRFRASSYWSAGDMEKLIDRDYLKKQTNCTSTMRRIYCFYMARHAWKSWKKSQGRAAEATYELPSLLHNASLRPESIHSALLCKVYQCANRAVKRGTSIESTVHPCHCRCVQMTPPDAD